MAAIEEAFSLLDAGEAGLHATRTRLKRMRDSVLAAAVTGQLVPQDPTDSRCSRLSPSADSESHRLRRTGRRTVRPSLGAGSTMSAQVVGSPLAAGQVAQPDRLEFPACGWPTCVEAR